MFNIIKLILRSMPIFIFLNLVIASFSYASQPQLIQSIDASMAAAIAKTVGFKVQPRQTKSGGDYLNTSVDGHHSAIMLLNCDSGQCQILRFYSIISQAGIQPELVNSWNSYFRFGRVYLQGEDEVIVEADLLLNGGVTHESVIQFLRRQSTLIESLQHLIKEEG